MVILLLGILAATALPRFLDVTEEAHDAVVDGTASALQTGMALYRAQWIAQQQAAPGSALDGGAVFGGLRVAASGYPIGLTNSATGVFDDDEADSALQCAEIYNGILQSGRAPVVVTAKSPADFLVPVVPTAATTETAANSDLFNINTGFVAKQVQGVTSVGSLAVLAADEFCVYVYAADANRRSTVDDAVPAIVYFPTATTGSPVIEAGTVVQVTL